MRFAMLSLAMLTTLACVTGCTEDGSREFSVTVLDATEIECTGFSSSDAFEQDTMDAIADDIRKQYKKASETDPPTPLGRRLWVNELERSVQAWFEPRPGQSAQMPEDPSQLAFDSPLVVYSGNVNESFIEGKYSDFVNTDDEDEDAGREPCGNRSVVEGVLQVTDNAGIDGRIRWTTLLYVASVVSSCAGHVSCVRDIRIEGLEVK